MDYIAHTVHTAEALGSPAHILWAAADLAATQPEVSDPIHEAGLRIIAAGHTTARRGKAAVELAAMIAADRHPTLAATIDGTDWANWQQVLTEPWPILVDAAAFAAKLGGLETQITPGYWIA
ncbi:hypothetical protein [Gordonia sp. UCD-TK1]|uniref:hypothetical protein n=1 Tax=Gordonia sp. UCD-TK1 TaxID=1857893 RepID=UPI00080EA11C|nr:hypothetical protein [Gordonia sp. UCD-TK1]OCH81493.1 hypothetical protein A9310_17590 [Gordonia sp. UCD-TK1]